jgi:hypothetical protein
MFLVHRFLSPWWWRCLIPPKLRFLQRPHGVTSRMTPFFMVTAVKTSNVTCWTWSILKLVTCCTWGPYGRCCCLVGCGTVRYVTANLSFCEFLCFHPQSQDVGNANTQQDTFSVDSYVLCGLVAYSNPETYGNQFFSRIALFVPD